VGALYSGISATVLGVAPYAGLKFASYEALKGEIWGDMGRYALISPYEALEITRDRSRSLEIARDHPRSLEITRDRSRSPRRSRASSARASDSTSLSYARGSA
jgi:hypothetical protein